MNIYLSSPEKKESGKLADISARFNIPLFENNSDVDSATFYLLELNNGKFKLVEVTGRKRKIIETGFTSGKMRHRLKTFSASQPLAKATGLGGRSANEKLTIFDATGGYGRDAACLAFMGANVVVCERNPVMYLLLESSLREAKDICLFPGEFECCFGKSESLLGKVEEKPDVIYLDPMYPQRKKSSLSKKDMQFLQSLEGRGSLADRNSLLDKALESAVVRVVVKRPNGITPMKQKFLRRSINGKIACFDIYKT